MKSRRMIRIGMLVVVLILAGLFAFSQLGREKPAVEKEEKIEPSSETTSRHEATPKPTAKPTKKPTPKPTKKPTPKPTPTATPTPTPVPVSVYVPREVLPDGRLFDQEYYAVLPGEGAYYNIFDCYGKQIDSFFYDTGYGDEPIGLLTEADLSCYHRINMEAVQVIEFTDQEYRHSALISCENGFYQKWYGEDTKKIVMYDEAGNHIRTLSFDDELEKYWELIDIRCHGNEMVVIYMSQPWDGDDTLADTTTTVYFIGMDGTINDQAEVVGPEVELFARKYLGPTYYGNTISDLNGNVLMEDVSSYAYSTVFGYPDSPYQVEISDYFMKDGKVYDASFQPVKKDTMSANGKLIFGVEYDVEGISCTAAYDATGNDYDYRGETFELTAIGYKDKQVGVKTIKGEYILDIENGLEFCGINQYGYLLYDEYKGTIQIVSLDTREVLNTISANPPLVIPEEYFILRTKREVNDENIYGRVIYDKEGNRRYAGEEISMMSMPGEYILLYRGPYVGIADLNGEWIMKTLTWQMTRDAEEIDYSY